VKVGGVGERIEQVVGGGKEVSVEIEFLAATRPERVSESGKTKPTTA
jgi:hypothetical protein